MRLHRLPSLAAGLTALCLPLLAIQAAQADGFISRVPTVHIAAAPTESQAQENICSQRNFDNTNTFTHPCGSTNQQLAWDEYQKNQDGGGGGQ